MRKIKNFMMLALTVAMVFASSCKKNEDSSATKAVQTIAASFTAKDGDFALKSDIVGVTRDWFVQADHGTGTFTPVTGFEFVTGSAAQLDWSASPGPWNLSATSSMYITYCPILPLKIISKTKNAAGLFTHIGVATLLAPTVNSFPLIIQGRRLGDKLIINANALTTLQGYGFVATVTYTLSTIDINATIAATASTTSGWPVYAFTGTDQVVTDQAITSGDCTVYEGIDKKIVGNVVVSITDNKGTKLSSTVVALGSNLGQYYSLKLVTTKGGFFDSAQANGGDSGAMDHDIALVSQDVPFN